MAAAAQSVEEMQQHMLKMQDELAVERAKRHHAERIWTEQLGDAQGMSMQTQSQASQLEQRVIARETEISDLHLQLHNMVNVVQAMKAKIQEWEAWEATEVTNEAGA